MEHAGYGAFCEAASAALEQEAHLLGTTPLDRLISLESRWHPNGFAVFHLDDYHKLGKLRLHIWPDSGRVVRPDDAPIHTHVWHLYSRILTGLYSETIYELSDPEVAGSKEYNSAAINYLVDKDSFTAPSRAFLRMVKTTHATNGGVHAVAADVPHETHVGEGSFVATLLVTSDPRSAQATMYSSEVIHSSSYERPLLTKAQKMNLLGRLEQELRGQTGCGK
ncbi:hypothetical protein J2Y41_004039 [Arthrobacter sp. 1088]|uniref:hypothetical protein n=1 Tax=Arthrobacter sp. 1088 TaxID=2817768 RepID=UPI00285C109A|nr:hypothetical protein [Arthrobacter sp. 1088]MDR6688449.1 hypothetical protein [Arthrobacter sp. 1088]